MAALLFAEADDPLRALRWSLAELLIRLYRLSGDDDAAERQYAAFRATLRDELGYVDYLRARYQRAEQTPTAAPTSPPTRRRRLGSSSMPSRSRRRGRSARTCCGSR